MMTTPYRQSLRSVLKKSTRQRWLAPVVLPARKASIPRQLVRLGRRVRLATAVSAGLGDLVPLVQRATWATLVSLVLLVQRVHSALLARLDLPGTPGHAARAVSRARPDLRQAALQAQLDRLAQLAALAVRARRERLERRELQVPLALVAPLGQFETMSTLLLPRTRLYPAPCGTEEAQSFSRPAPVMGQGGS